MREKNESEADLQKKSDQLSANIWCPLVSAWSRPIVLGGFVMVLGDFVDVARDTELVDTRNIANKGFELAFLV